MSIATIALIVSSLVTALLVFLGVARWMAARAIQEDVPGAGDDVRSSLPEHEQLPHGHRPPLGLGPISPSERFLSAEAERGLRDLTAYLLDAA